MPAATSSDSNDILQLCAETRVKNRPSQSDALAIIKLFKKRNISFVLLRVETVFVASLSFLNNYTIRDKNPEDILSLK